MSASPAFSARKYQGEFAGKNVYAFTPESEAQIGILAECRIFLLIYLYGSTVIAENVVIAVGLLLNNS